MEIERVAFDQFKCFELLASHSRDIVLFLRLEDGRIVEVNEVAQTSYGYSRQELLSLGVGDLYGPDSCPMTESQMTMANTEGLLLETIHQRKDGSSFPVEVSMRGTTLNGVRTLVCVVRDISERKRSEDALRESEERLRLAQEVAHVGTFEWNLQTGTNIWTRELEAMYGLPHGSHPTTLSAWECLLHPDDRAEAVSLVQKSFATGALSEGEYRVVWPDGSVHWLSARWQVFKDEHGKPIRTTGISLDITDRKCAEDALRRSRQGLSRLAEVSLSVMAQTDLQGMLQAISDAALVLTGARIATCCHALVNGQLVTRGSSHLPCASPAKMFHLDKDGVHLALVGGEESIRFTDEQLRADPRRRIPEGHVPLRGLLGVRMLDGSGRTSGMILVTDKDQGDFTLEDQTLLEQLATVASLGLQHVDARTLLEEADRCKNEFLAMLSHELRDPLAPIRNSVYILNRIAGTELTRRARSVIDRQVTHLTRLVDDLLDVTRVSRGKILLKREPLDLSEVMQRTVEDHRQAFTESRIRLQVTIRPGPIWIDGDRTRLAQILGNLLQNASKFTPPGGTVYLSLEASEELGEATARVRDTGAGIASEALGRIFEPFTQLNPALDPTKGGLGLGLALVKGLVEVHGGTVSVASEGPGKGTEFTIRLPLGSKPVQGPLNDEPAFAESRIRRGQRILIIEDNYDAADSLRDILELLGHTVEVAYSGPSGIQKADVFHPEVVLCDLGLPGMNGYEVAKGIRANPVLQKAILVALTGYAGSEDVIRSKEAGFDEHLAKPPSLEQLELVLSRG